MPTVVDTVKRWNPEIEKYLEHKFDCYYQYEDDNVVAESVHVRITVIHKYTHYTVGKVTVSQQKHTNPSPRKTVVRINPSCDKSHRIPHISFEFQ